MQVSFIDLDRFDSSYSTHSRPMYPPGVLLQEPRLHAILLPNLLGVGPLLGARPSARTVFDMEP